MYGLEKIRISWQEQHKLRIDKTPFKKKAKWQYNRKINALMNTVPVYCKMCYVEDKEHWILFLYTVKCAMMKYEYM